MMSISLLVASLLLVHHTTHHQIYYCANAATTDAKENEVREILQRMESDALEFRDEIERMYRARCETKTLVDCGESNFNDCSSSFPGQVCMEANELVVMACGDGVSCNGE